MIPANYNLWHFSIRLSPFFNPRTPSQVENIRLELKNLLEIINNKAAGGISTVEDMEKFLALGADRLGTSRAVKILNGEQAKGY